jgi:hypothetical protein
MPLMTLKEKAFRDGFIDNLFKMSYSTQWDEPEFNGFGCKEAYKEGWDTAFSANQLTDEGKEGWKELKQSINFIQLHAGAIYEINEAKMSLT